MLQLEGLAVHAQRQKALERLQKNLKEEYRAVVDYEVAFFNTVGCLGLMHSVSSACKSFLLSYVVCKLCPHTLCALNSIEVKHTSKQHLNDEVWQQLCIFMCVSLQAICTSNYLF